MRLLILGGTRFLGRATAVAALERSHELTLFNRGLGNPDLFPEARRLRADRDGGLDALRGESWDAVIDTSGYLPRVVEQSVERVDAGYYLFVSTRSVYADLSDALDEDAPVHAPVRGEDVGAHYGELKAMCEDLARRRPGAIVRPGLIVGPHDPTGRFTYWPHRVARGGEVLAPGDPAEPVSLIDVRDLAEWLVRLCEAERQGTFNAIALTTWGELLDGCVRAAGGRARVVWVPTPWLVDHGVREWVELPLWVASSEALGMHRVSNARAVDAGLSFRPLTDTIAATIAEALPTAEAGLSAEREQALLAAWAAEAARGG